MIKYAVTRAQKRSGAECRATFMLSLCFLDCHGLSVHSVAVDLKQKEYNKYLYICYSMLRLIAVKTLVCLKKLLRVCLMPVNCLVYTCLVSSLDEKRRIDLTVSSYKRDTWKMLLSLFLWCLQRTLCPPSMDTKLHETSCVYPSNLTSNCMPFLY